VGSAASDLLTESIGCPVMRTLIESSQITSSYPVPTARKTLSLPGEPVGESGARIRGGVIGERTVPASPRRPHLLPGPHRVEPVSHSGCSPVMAT